MGQAEGHPLLIQPAGSAGIGTGGGKGVAAVVIQHFLYSNIEPLGAKNFLTLHIALHCVADKVVRQRLHFLHVFLRGVQRRTSGQGIVLTGLADVGLVNELVDIDKGKLGTQHICHLFQTDEVAHIADRSCRTEPCGTEYSGLPQHLLYPQYLQKIQGFLPCAVGIAFKSSGTSGGDQDRLHTLGTGDGNDGFFRLLQKVDHQIGQPPHWADHVNIHIVLALKHLIQNLRGHQKFLVPVNPNWLHNVEMRTGEVFRQLLMGALDKLGVGHVVEFLGKLKVLAHAAGAFKHIVMVQCHQNRTYIKLHVFSEMDHNFFLLIYNL